MYDSFAIPVTSSVLAILAITATVAPSASSLAQPKPPLRCQVSRVLAALCDHA